MNIIAIVGMPAAGKSVLAGYFRGAGHPVVHFGYIVLDELKRLGQRFQARSGGFAMTWFTTN